MYHKLAHYKSAGRLLQEAKENGKNAKTTLYTDKKYKFMNIKSLYALVNETLKHWDVIQALIKESNILVDESGLNIWLVRILITELLFGKKVIDSENKIGETILRYEAKFNELLSTSSIKKLLKEDNPKKNIKVRYIKVNTIVESVDSVIDCFVREGWECLSTSDSYDGYLNQLRDLEPGSSQFLQDLHIPEVFAFPAGTELHFHELYNNGSFTLMDKSSCLAPFLLRPHSGSTVLDMCAAPGLKTVHLAGLVGPGKVYAVERDAGRFQSLQDMVNHCGAQNVTLIHKDVTKLNVEEFADVEYILLDPSCSGSGIRDRQPNIELEAHSNDQNRLYRLAGFQLTLLRFALTRFPAAKRIVYSTCSLNVEENEEVVQSALNSKYHDFEIVSIKKKVPQWINFGSNYFEFGSKCIYSQPDTDLTNGFFVAVFERKKHYSKKKDETNDSVGKPEGGEYKVEVKEEISNMEIQYKREIFHDGRSILDNKKVSDKEYLSHTRNKNHDYNHESDVMLSKKRKYDQCNNNYPVYEKALSSYKTFEKCNGESVKGNKNTLNNSMGLHKGEEHKNVKSGLKYKLSVSAKKRIRKRKIKVVNKHITTKTIKNITRKKEDNNKKDSITDTNEVKNEKKLNKPVSKAQLRYKRLKTLKLAKQLGKVKEDDVGNNSDIDNKKKSKSNKKKKANIDLVRDKLKDDYNEVPTSEIDNYSKKKSHKKKRNTDTLIQKDSLINDGAEDTEINELPPTKYKKKRSKSLQKELSETATLDDEHIESSNLEKEICLNHGDIIESHRNKSKKKHNKETCLEDDLSRNNEDNNLLNDMNIVSVKKKKRKSNTEIEECSNISDNLETEFSFKSKKRKHSDKYKKEKNKNDESENNSIMNNDLSNSECMSSTSKKHKNRDKSLMPKGQVDLESQDDINSEIIKHKSKKKSKVKVE